MACTEWKDEWVASLYDELDSLPKDLPAVMIDMAGNGEVVAGVHERLGNQLRYSCTVGATHWEAKPRPTNLPGPEPVFFFAPGMIGPPLGFWIPICCIVGTLSGFSQKQSARIRKTVAGTTVLAMIALVGFGAHDYLVYNRMPAAEKERLIPVWEKAAQKVKQKAG